MIIFKPKTNAHRDCLDEDDSFYKHSHGMMDGEFTLCGIACDEWHSGGELARKRITCPDCLSLIRLCREYRL